MGSIQRMLAICRKTMPMDKGNKDTTIIWHSYGVWWKQKNHVDDCYYCLTKTSGYSKKTRQKLSYPNLDSAIRPVPYSHEIPVPVFTELPSLENEDDICKFVNMQTL